MKITGVVLAAGNSSRMDSSNKLLLPFGKHTVIEETVAQVAASNVDELLVITGHESERIAERLCNQVSSRVRIVYNPDYQSGRAESIKCAVRHIGESAAAVLFMVGDKPGVTTSLINRAVDCFKRNRPSVLFVETPAGRGHPIIFFRSLFEELLHLQGDMVGDELLAKFEKNTVRLKDSNAQIDIDTVEDYRALLDSLEDSRTLSGDSSDT